MKNEISQILSEVRSGLSISEPHGHLIYSGEQSLILLSKFYKNKIGKLLYLLEGADICYGLIRLNLPYKIGMDEFNELCEQHKVTMDEKNNWWPNKEVLYAYKFDTIKLFDEPKKLAFLKDLQTFVSDFKFLDDMINGPKTYDPNKVSKASLMADWRIVNAWYAAQQSGHNINHSLEDIVILAKMIYSELKKRGVILHQKIMISKELSNLINGKAIDLNIRKFISLNDKSKQFVNLFESYRLQKINND